MKYHFRVSQRPDGRFSVICIESFYCATIADLRADVMSAARRALKEYLQTPSACGLLPMPYSGDLEELELRYLPDGKIQGEEVIAVPVEPGAAFALTLRRVRTNRGFFQRDVAQRLGVSAAAYQQLEDPLKANPTIKTLQRLINIFPALDVTRFFEPPVTNGPKNSDGA